MPAVDVMMPQFHLLPRYPAFQQIQNTGQAVIAAGKQDR